MLRDINVALNEVSQGSVSRLKRDADNRQVCTSGKVNLTSSRTTVSVNQNVSGN
jgi:hypothetical protein